MEKEFDQLLSSRPSVGFADVEKDSKVVVAMQRPETMGYVRQAYLDMEVSAHQETLASLEHSENSVRRLVSTASTG